MDNREDLGFKYRTFHRDNAHYWNNHANQRQFELSKQLITISSIILTVSVAFIVSSGRSIGFYSQPLTSFSLLISWILTLVSISCGLKQLEVDTEYFNYLSKDESLRQSKFALLPFEIAKSEVDRMMATESRGSEKWLLVQQIFFILGIVSTTLSAFFILTFGV